MEKWTNYVSVIIFFFLPVFKYQFSFIIKWDSKHNILWFSITTKFTFSNISNAISNITKWNSNITILIINITRWINSSDINKWVSNINKLISNSANSKTINYITLFILIIPRISDINKWNSNINKIKWKCFVWLYGLLTKIEWIKHISMSKTQWDRTHIVKFSQLKFWILPVLRSCTFMNQVEGWSWIKKINRFAYFMFSMQNFARNTNSYMLIHPPPQQNDYEYSMNLAKTFC